MQCVFPKFMFYKATKLCSKSYKSNFVDIKTLSASYKHLCVVLCIVCLTGYFVGPRLGFEIPEQIVPARRDKD